MQKPAGVSAVTSSSAKQHILLPADQREESWDTYCQNRMLTDALNQEPSILYTKTERFFVQISVLRLKNLNFLHSRRLIDKFHRQLVNFICRSGLIESLAMSSIAKICQNHNNNLQLLSMFGKSSFFPGEKTFPW